jgi:hypothetical protein
VRKQCGRSTRFAVLLLALCCLTPASASALEHPFLEDFGAANEPTFTEAQGMAVDQSTGDLLVIDAGNREAGEGTLSRWHEDGTPSEFSALGGNVIEGLSFRFPETEQMAVDNSGGATDGNIYIASQTEAGLVRIFDEDGSSLGQLTEYNAGPAAEGVATPFGTVCGVAVDPEGNLYVSEGSSGGAIHKYEPTGNPPVSGDSSANFPFPHPCTLAAGAGATEGFIFLAEIFGVFPTGGVAKLSSATGAEQYEVDPGPTTTVAVDPGSGHVLIASGSEVREYDASEAGEALPLEPIAPGGERVHAIAVNETTGNVYVARKGNPRIEVWGPAVTLPEAVTEAASSTGGIITLHGGVNAAGGPPATCAFEYVEVHSKGFEGASSVPCSPAGPFTGSSAVSISAQLKGLPEAFYRFRLVASNENGSSRGKTLFFDTLERLALPDGRAYEMVSPPVKVGEVIPPEPYSQFGSCGQCLPGEINQIMPMQSAPDGNSVLYEGQPFTNGLAAGPNEYLATRSPGGWSSKSLSSPLFSQGGGYTAFSTDLSRGVLSQFTSALSPEAPTRGGKAFANLYLRDEGGSLQPLVTEEPPHRDPGTGSPDVFIARYAGANAGTASKPAFEHLIFEANDALTEEVPGIAPEAPEVEAGTGCAFLGANCNLYEWVGGQLRLVNLLPGNAAAAPSGAVIGAGRLLTTGSKPPNVDHAISDDGSKIFWSEQESGHVYVRVDGEETLEVPGPGLCKESVPLNERVCFLTASADGSKVLLSDGQLYELSGAGDAYQPTSDLTEGQGGFEGILGAAEDLSRIYFVDVKALTEASEENANGEHAEDGELNLYAWEGGEATFIGALTGLDNDQGFIVTFGTWTASRPNRTAQVSPDGRYLAFMSHASLTGYDNRRKGGGNCVGSISVACNEVFQYDALADNLVCVSCNPSGERPVGHSTLSVTKGNLGFPPLPQPGNLSAQGRIFFESHDALLPRDTNGVIQDVYEWEPQGVGSCKRAGGCVYLISSGQSTNDSMFMDSTPSGDDAFFITREQLVAADKDEQLDLYDARVGGGIPSETETLDPECQGEACQPAALVPNDPTPSSAAFSGAGNVKERGTPRRRCPKGKRKVRRNGKARCAKTARKRAANSNRGGVK